MKMRYFILILCGLFYNAHIEAQISGKSDCLYFYGDSIICSDSIVYGSYRSKDKYQKNEKFFLVDTSRMIAADDVKFYKKGTEFYANLFGVEYNDSSVFAKRTFEGNINIYQIFSYYNEPDPQTGMYHSSDQNYSVLASIRYYNKGLGDLKQLRYKNLKVDLIDNPESVLYLKKFRNLRRIQTILNIVGGFALASGIYARTKDHVKTAESQRSIAIGVSCLAVSVPFMFNKSKSMKKAIDVYNK